MTDLKGIHLIEFVGDACAACHALLPVINNVMVNYPEIKFHHWDIDEGEEYIRAWNIERLPTVVLADDGIPFARFNGYQPEEIIEIWIEAKLEEHIKNKTEA